ncbi:AT-rich interactive domain-containing protein 6-like isoform X2 [Rhododendron vialii]|uniref:AT-rich interactive domain-containing protein 6-like isoform X2 n=1 Tax=Rhododendron vialii TaxID=182163 RepID=UPI00266012E8|nr:AT-rich interactive domain-containing protein 6-like isoform X2 [Rhododendron vialii]
MVKVTDEHDGVSNDIAVEDTEVEKDESTYLGDKDSTHSTDRLAGNKESLQSDYANVGNKECVLPHHIQNPIATARLHPEDDLEHPDVRSLELPKEGSSLEEKSLIEPSAVDPANNASPNEPQDRNEKFEDMHLDPPIQSDSIRLVEMSVKTQADDEIGKELKRGLTVMELDEGIAAKEDELNYGEMRAEFLPEHETKDHESNSEELNVGVTDLELPQNTGTKEEELDDVMTGTELTPDNGIEEESNGAVMGKEVLVDSKIKNESRKDELDVGVAIEDKSSNRSFLLESNDMADEWGTEEEQAAFMRELETFHKERFLEFKPPRFYGEPLNCLKLWRAVIRLGGYEQVTSCKYWRQVGESFKPPKTCTTVSWTFRCFYEKALLEYEKHKMRSGELPFTDASFTEPASAGNLPGMHQASGPGRARRDAAARAMQGWHSQRLLGNGEVGDPLIKDKNSTSTPRREKYLKSIGLLKRKRPSPVERAVKAGRLKASKSQSDTMVVDIGPSADWVKINVQRTKDCYEVYALVPGLLREEVRVQSDPAGRLVISGQPEQLDNPWGVTPFKKVVSLPSRIDPHQTSAVVTLHGQLFVRVPFEQSDLQ